MVLPHKSAFYLITCGVSLKGAVVAKLGNEYRVNCNEDVGDLGYAGEYVGMPVFE